MKRQEFPGGIYPDARPNGSYVCLKPNERTVETHLGVFPYPAGVTANPGLLFTRLTDVSTFKFAAKAHEGSFIHLWQHGGWTTDPRDSYGTQGHIWDDAGVLHVQTYHGEGTPSQGYRYWDGVAISGADTYNHMTAFARWHRITEMYGWTERDGIAIGQGAALAAGGGVVVQIHGTRRLLDTGPCTFIEFHRSGDSVAVAYCKPNGAVIVWCSVAELAALPLYPDAVVEPPPVDPDPPIVDPEPPSMDFPRNDWELVEQVHERFAQQCIDQFPGNNDEAARAWTRMAIEQLVFSRPEGGWCWKSGDPNRPPSKDVIARRRDGTLEGWDVLSAAGANGPTTLAPYPPQYHDLTGQNRIAVDGVNHLGSEPTEPEPPPVDDELEDRVEDLEAQDKRLGETDQNLATAILLLEARHNQLLERVVALEAKPGSAPFVPSDYQTRVTWNRINFGTFPLENKS
jgi:hypothetical protein